MISSFSFTLTDIQVSSVTVLLACLVYHSISASAGSVKNANNQFFIHLLETLVSLGLHSQILFVLWSCL